MNKKRIIGASAAALVLVCALVFLPQVMNPLPTFGITPVGEDVALTQQEHQALLESIPQASADKRLARLGKGGDGMVVLTPEEQTALFLYSGTEETTQLFRQIYENRQVTISYAPASGFSVGAIDAPSVPKEGDLQEVERHGFATHADPVRQCGFHMTLTAKFAQGKKDGVPWSEHLSTDMVDEPIPGYPQTPNPVEATESHTEIVQELAYYECVYTLDCGAKISSPYLTAYQESGVG